MRSLLYPRLKNRYPQLKPLIKGVVRAAALRGLFSENRLVRRSSHEGDVRACPWDTVTDACSGWRQVAHLTRATCLGLALALVAAPCRADDVTFDIKNVDASVAQKFKKEFLAKKDKV